MIHFIMNLYDLGGLDQDVLSLSEIEVVSDKIAEMNGSMKQFEYNKFLKLLNMPDTRP